jgi:hypothetical protein
MVFGRVLRLFLRQSDPAMFYGGRNISFIKGSKKARLLILRLSWAEKRCGYDLLQVWWWRDVSEPLLPSCPDFSSNYYVR